MDSKQNNPWIVHCRKIQSENPDMKWKQVLQEAKKTYNKQHCKQKEVQ